jgi:hypothetical protein
MWLTCGTLVAVAPALIPLKSLGEFPISLILCIRAEDPRWELRLLRLGFGSARLWLFIQRLSALVEMLVFHRIYILGPSLLIGPRVHLIRVFASSIIEILSFVSLFRRHEAPLAFHYHNCC